jgi:uncharacterized membrane-anchored protein
MNLEAKQRDMQRRMGSVRRTEFCLWRWDCPTCKRFGYQRWSKPTFSRCWDCDCKMRNAPPLKIVRIL